MSIGIATIGAAAALLLGAATAAAADDGSDDGGATALDEPVGAATITLVTETVPAGEPTSPFTMSASGPVSVSGATGDPAVTGATVPVGEYTLASQSVPYWARDPWSCTLNGGGSFSVAIAGGTVTLVGGDALRCTMVRYRFAAVTLLATTDPPGATGGFQLGLAGANSGAVEIDGTSGATGRLPAGFYRLSATDAAGWERGDWDCGGAHRLDDDGRLRLEYGDVVTCTISYTSDAPTDATLTLAAVTEPTGNEGLFTLSATGPVTIAGVSGTPTVTGATVPAGEYSLEGALANWARSSWSCRRNGGSAFTVLTSDPQLTLAAGDAVVCTRTFRRSPHLTLLATTNPAGGEGAFELWAQRDVGGIALPGPSGTNGYVSPNRYQPMASTVTGWLPGAWACDGGEPFDDEGYIRLRYGDVVICTLAHSWTGSDDDTTTTTSEPDDTTTTTSEPDDTTTTTSEPDDTTTTTTEPDDDTTTTTEPAGAVTSGPAAAPTTTDDTASVTTAVAGSDGTDGARPGGPGAAAPPQTDGSAATPADAAEQLPVTGAGDHVVLLALVGLATLLGGAAAVSVARRREHVASSIG